MQRGFGHSQRGAVLPLVAITLAVLMGFAGMAVDIGFLNYQGQVQQAATDAAAAGGAQAAYANSCANYTLARAAAVNDATMNGYTQSSGSTLAGSSGPTVTVNTPPSTGPYAGNPCAVAVTITSNKQTFFSKFFGQNSMPETTQAVGLAPTTANGGCLYALSTSLGQSNLSNMTITTPHCNMYLNDGANMSNSTFDANAISYVGSNNTSGTNFTSAKPALMSSAEADPCPSWTGCNWLTNNALPTSPCTNMGSGTYVSGQTIGSATTPTCFSGLTVSGTNVTMCGLIEITGSQLHLNNSSISSCSSGVTIAMGSNVSDINFSNSTLNLSAPTTGNTADVVMWRNPAQNNSVNFSNCTCNLTGMVYFPTAPVTYSSAGGSYTIMVFGQVNFSTSTMGMGTPPPGYGDTSVTLAQ